MELSTSVHRRTGVSAHSACSTRGSEEYNSIAHDLDVVQQRRTLLTSELPLGRVQRHPAQQNSVSKWFRRCSDPHFLSDLRSMGNSLCVPAILDV